MLKPLLNYLPLHIIVMASLLVEVLRVFLIPAWSLGQQLEAFFFQHSPAFRIQRV